MKRIMISQLCLLAMLSGLLQGQENTTINHADLGKGVVLRVDLNALVSGSEALIVESDENVELALIDARRQNGDIIWHRQSQLIPLSATVHWQFQEPSQRLVIDISQLSADTGEILLTVIPIKVQKAAIRLTLSTASESNPSPNSSLTEVKTLNVDINETEE